MNLIFMGSPEFAIPSLKVLIDSPHKVVAVYSQPPKPANRGQKETPTPIHQLAEQHGIPVYTPTSLKSPEVQAEFAARNADVAIVAAYGLLLPKPILDACPRGCINVHPSLLPRWRGAAPIQRTIMAGDTETGICIMQMEEGLDTGPVLACERFSIPESMTSGELHDILAERAGPLLLDVLANNPAGVPQAEQGVEYAAKISKSEARIDWSKPAAAIAAHINGLSPKPGAYFIYNGEQIKILRATASPSTIHRSPSTVLDSNLAIATADGVLLPLELQRPGGKRLKTAELLKGWTIPPGTKLE